MTLIKEHVDQLFKEARGPKGELGRNPVTGWCFVWGLDSFVPQKWIAYRAVLAREWFALNGPRDAPPLPVHAFEVADMKHGGGFRHMLAYYAPRAGTGRSGQAHRRSGRRQRRRSVPSRP